MRTRRRAAQTLRQRFRLFMRRVQDRASTDLTPRPPLRGGEGVPC